MGRQKNGYRKVKDSTSNKNTPPHQHNQAPSCPRPIMVKSETSSGSHVCLQLTPAVTSSSAGYSQGPLQRLWLLCARRNILYLLPLLQSARWYLVLTSKKLDRDDLFFLPDLVINAREDAFFTRKLQRGTRLAKPQKPVPGRRPKAPGIPIVISPQVYWICWLKTRIVSGIDRNNICLP